MSSSALILKNIDMSSSPATKQAGLNLTLKILSNILTNPKEPKFRRINLEGKAGAKLIAVPSLVELLVSNGFIEADGHLELSEDAPIEPIILARSAVESFIESSNPTLPVATPVSTANLSLKQKALIQQEEKKIEARKLAKIDRQEQLAKIEQDKLVRSKDENWSAQAAGVKGGKAIETYRGKFGEDQGGG